MMSPRLMNRVFLILTTMLLTASAMAGCHTQEDTAPGGGQDNNITQSPDPEVTGVEVVKVPPSAESGGSAIVCWRVDGHGTIPHTAIHYDNTSHPGEQVEFGEYGPGVSYPDNATQQDPDGYEIPRSFCTSIPVQNDTVYFRAHAMVTAPGLLSPEHSIAVTSG